MTYCTLKYDPATGICSGPHFYEEQPSELPAGEIACTADQAAKPTLWKVSNGALVAVPPTLDQQAESLLASGLQISSTSTPSVNGVYSCDQNAQARINRLYSLIQRNSGAFPSGLTSLPYPKMDGLVAYFPNPTVFLDFETKLGEFVLACDLIITTGTGTLPSASATIV